MVYIFQAYNFLQLCFVKCFQIYQVFYFCRTDLCDLLWNLLIIRIINMLGAIQGFYYPIRKITIGTMIGTPLFFQPDNHFDY